MTQKPILISGPLRCHLCGAVEGRSTTEVAQSTWANPWRTKGLGGSLSSKALFLWLRGLDLNQRPLGYEPFSNQHWNQRATNNAS
jgi:hypothetical protein